MSPSEYHPDAVVTVPLRIHSPLAVATGYQPIRVGVPFAKGAVRDGWRTTLTDGGGVAIASQTTTLARWSDGSIRWLLVDFLASELRAGVNEVFLKLSPGAVDATRQGRELAGAVSEKVLVRTGVAVFEIDRRRGAPLCDIRLADDATSLASCRIELTDRKGRRREARIESVRVETDGPVRTTVCAAGCFPGVGLRFRARLCFFDGTGLARARLTLHNPRRARHRGGLWDLGDAGSICFRDLSLRINLGGTGTVSWTAAVGEASRQSTGGEVEIHQNSSGGENWQSRNHVNSSGRVPCQFQGYRVRTNGEELLGRRAEPVARWEVDHASVVVSVPEFWQQFPKTIAASARSMRVGLFPEEWDDLFELQGGERKTHTLWLRIGSKDQLGEDALDWTHRPAVIMPAPGWFAAAQALPDLLPADDDPNDKLAGLMDEALTGDRGLFAKRETVDEYGWRNFGDVWADHENAYYEGPKPVISHYNNQYDFIDGAITQMARTGDPRWFDLFDPLARHVMDIDIYHTQRDRAAYAGGMYWLTDHYVDAATSTHRTYSRTNASRNGGPYGGGPGSGHNFATGLLHYYYLTGDADALAAVLGLADWVLRMDDGQRNLLGLVDDGPTGLATLWAERGRAGPARGAANSINVLLDAWLASRDEVYLAKAEELIRRCVHPRQDIAALNLLQAETKWSYTMFLSAVARYLEIQAERGATGAGYAYAQASLVHYARWMLVNERPYLDRPEELEYPTETWAAQEFRKANVLRLASRHVGADEARTMCRRGDELADRAWADLRGFGDACLVSRVLAILMREGTRDVFFRARPARAMPPADEDADFGEMEEFVTQKARVLGQLRTLAGVGRAVARLAQPDIWRRAFRLAAGQWCD